LLIRGIRVDLEDDLDPVEAVAHLAVDAEDALDVHAGFERRLHGAELNVPVLRDGRDAGGEARCERDEHVLDRRRAVVLGRENLRMVRVVAERGPVRLLRAEPEEAVHDGTAVRAANPFARRAPLEARRLGCFRESLPCAEQRFDVDAVIGLDCGDVHVGCSPRWSVARNRSATGYGVHFAAGAWNRAWARPWNFRLDRGRRSAPRYAGRASGVVNAAARSRAQSATGAFSRRASAALWRTKPASSFDARLASASATCASMISVARSSASAHASASVARAIARSCRRRSMSMSAARVCV